MEDKKNNFKELFSIEKRTEYFVYILAFFCVASVAVFILLVIGGKSLNKKEGVLTEETADPFESVALEAKSAIVFDVINNRELFSKNPDLSLPLASLTKILTAIMTNEKLEDNQKIEITEKDLEPEGDSGLMVGDTWLLADLRDFTLLTSSNDGASALAASIGAKITSNSEMENRLQFIKSMNDTASVIGLLNSRFFNEHGLDREADRGGAYGSARDVAALFEYTIKNHPDLLEATRYKSLEFRSAENTYAAENTNPFVDKIPNLIASKTGFTDLAGGNLVIAFDAGLGRLIIISVLGSTQEGRFEDALKLVETAIKQIPNL